MGGANQSGWNLGEPVQQLLRTAGAVLLQREIPEEINLQVAQVVFIAEHDECGPVVRGGGWREDVW